MIFSSFYDSFFVRNKGCGWSCSCAVSRGSGSTNPARRKGCGCVSFQGALAAWTAPWNVICGTHFCWCCPLWSQGAGESLHDSRESQQGKQVLLAGKLPWNRPGWGLGDTVCTGFVGKPSWQEMPPGPGPLRAPSHHCCLPGLPWAPGEVLIPSSLYQLHSR